MPYVTLTLATLLLMSTASAQDAADEPRTKQTVQESAQMRIITADAVGDGPLLISTIPIMDSEFTLEGYADRFPAADANADGRVTMREREAFLAARALAAPQRVMREFPRADANADGMLDASEAADMVSNPFFGVALPGPDELHEGGATFEIQLDTDTTVDDGGGVQEVRRIVINGQEIQPGKSPANWLENESDIAVDQASVARVLDEIATARRETYHTIHPDADTDGDGTLTAAEQSAHEEALMARMRERMELFEKDLDFDSLPRLEDGSIDVEQLRERVVESSVSMRGTKLDPEALEQHREAGTIEPQRLLSPEEAAEEELKFAEGQSPEELARRGQAARVKLDAWAVYTQDFIKRYKLNDMQKRRALEILQRAYEARDRFEQRPKVKGAENRKAIIAEQRTRIFERQLKPRLERLPTREQRAAAGAAGEQ